MLDGWPQIFLDELFPVFQATSQAVKQAGEECAHLVTKYLLKLCSSSSSKNFWRGSNLNLSRGSFVTKAKRSETDFLSARLRVQFLKNIFYIVNDFVYSQNG